MKVKTKKDIWFIIGIAILLLYVVFLIYPIYNLLIKAVYNTSTNTFTTANFARFFSKSFYFKTLLNSFKVTMAVTILSICIGTPMAYFMCTIKIKGKRYILILIILASMSAPFIGAYSWILLLGRSGVITTFLSRIGIKIGDIYGFNGIL
ncbi:MAG: iron ABC transporter permease, partial [Bacilli bacterium]